VVIFTVVKPSEMEFKFSSPMRNEINPSPNSNICRSWLKERWAKSDVVGDGNHCI